MRKKEGKERKRKGVHGLWRKRWREGRKEKQREGNRQTT